MCNRLKWNVCVLSTLLVADVGLADGHKVIMSNGDSLHGKLLSAAPDRGAELQHGHADRPVIFAYHRLKRIELARRAPVTFTNGACAVHLTNGDMLLGSVISLEDERLRLRMRHGAEVPIRKSAISNISLVPPGRILFNGFPKGDKWILIPKAVRPANDDEVYCLGHSFVGVNANLPVKAQLDFTVKWGAAPIPGFRAALYAQHAKNFNSAPYALSCHPNGFAILRPDGRVLRSVAKFKNEVLPDGEAREARFRLFLDRAARRLVVYVNERKAIEWTDPNDSGATGSCVIFYAYELPIRVTELVVREWTGKMPPEREQQEAQNENDVLELKNGDKVTGTLVGASATALTMKTSYASMEIPFDRVSALRIAPDEGDQPGGPDEGEVIVRLLDGGAMTLRRVAVDEDELTGRGDSYGDITLPLNLVAILEFSPTNT